MDANDAIDSLAVTWCLPLAIAAAVVLVGCVVLAGVEAVVVAVRGSHTWRWSPAPQSVRRLAFAACGVTLALPSAVATASEPRAPAQQEQSCPPSCPSRLSGLRLPDLPVRERPSRPGGVVVQSGDSLWTIAAAQLPPSAGDTRIAARTQALYRTNRDLIGADPDLIFPGTFLTEPEDPR